MDNPSIKQGDKVRLTNVFITLFGYEKIDSEPIVVTECNGDAVRLGNLIVNKKYVKVVA